jgi:DNA-binding beta-propeller fold protein YncE
MLAVADQAQDAVNLYEISGPTLRLKKAVPAGKAPGRMCIDSAGATLFVANASGAQAIDLGSQSASATFTDPGIKRTFGCIVSRDNQKLYLADRDANTIFVFSIPSHQLLKKISGCDDVRYGIYTPDRKSLIFSCGAGSLAVIDPATDTVKRTVKTIGMDPRSMVFTPDGKYLGVAMVSSDMVNWYRADTLEPVSSFGVTRSPQALEIAPDGERAYVGGFYEGVIGVIDLREKNREGEGEWRQSSAIPVGPAYSVEVSSDGNYLYATPTNDAITVVDLRSWKILRVPLKGAGNLLYIK